MIYLSAGGGYLGGSIVEQLAHSGQRVRALVLNKEEARAIQGQNVEAVIGNRARPETYANTLKGCDVAMLVTRNALDLVEKDAAFCKAAKAAGVPRIVKVSAFGADVNAEKGAKRVHGESEQAVRDSGVEWTFLRPQFFQQNMLWFADEIRTSGAFSLPMGAGRVGMLDYRDLAAVAAKCLTEAGHEGKSYNLSGPALISCDDIAKTISRATGLAVRFNDMAPAAFTALLMSMGRPAWHAEEMTVSYVGMSKGSSAVLTQDVERILGRPATSFEHLAQDYAPVFLGVAA